MKNGPTGFRPIIDLGYSLKLCGTITLGKEQFDGIIQFEPYQDVSFSLVIGPLLGNHDPRVCYEMDMSKKQAEALLKHLKYWLEEQHD